MNLRSRYAGALYGALTALVLALLLASAPSRALADEELEVAVVSVDDSAFPVVRVVLTADQFGRPVETIPAEALSVVEGDRPATVRSIDPAVDASANLALVVALDTSGSVEGATLREAQAAATALVESLGPADAAAVLAFANEVTQVGGLTTDALTTTAAIAALEASGNTALYEAVNAAAEVAAGAEAPRRAVVLLTDGRDFGGVSSVTREESLSAAAAAPALFYAIGVGADVDRAYLEELAAVSGGRAFFAEGAADVSAIYGALEERLRSQFILEIESSAEAAPLERTLRIELTLDAASTAVVTEYESLRPPPTLPAVEATSPPVSAQAPPVATPALPVAAAPVAEEAGSSPLMTVLLLASVAALLLGVGVAVAHRLRKTRFTDALPSSHRGGAQTREASSGALVIELPDGLVVTDVGAEPVTIGSGAGCQVQLPPAADIAAQHARLWVRDGRPMLHHLARGHQTWIGEHPVDWAALHDGDEVRIGAVSMRYQDRRVAPVPRE